MPTTTAMASPTSRLTLENAANAASRDVLDQVASQDSGLSAAEAARRLAKFGHNVVGSHRIRAFTVLGGQVRNPLILLLLVCAAVSGFTGDPTDAIIIAVIIGLSVGLGFVNEYRAELAVAALHDRIRRQASVWRDGRQQKVEGLLHDRVTGWVRPPGWRVWP